VSVTGCAGSLVLQADDIGCYPFLARSASRSVEGVASSTATARGSDKDRACVLGQHGSRAKWPAGVVTNDSTHVVSDTEHDGLNGVCGLRQHSGQAKRPAGVVGIDDKHIVSDA
jgi:hypothetical protein